MIATYDALTPEALAPLGFEDPAQACRLLQGVAGHDVPDAAFDALLRAVMPALAQCADPDRAVTNLGRWADAVGSRASYYALLAAHPPAARMLITLFAGSQFFADLLIQTPEYLEILTNPAIRDRSRDADALWADLSRRVAIMKTPNAKRDALRRFKPPEVLRIGARDLLGDADMPETARAISDFADVCVRMALKICQEERGGNPLPFIVLALGKQGGRELNYASDIDLMFVHGEEAHTRDAIKLGEAVRDTLARVTPAGFVFRVDLRLRPEGRFGPLSRSLESCRAYYESWAEPWERQALMKVRPVAGDPALGLAFQAMAEAFVYRPRVEDTFVAAIQANKRRLEEKVARAGESEWNVKAGIGGIRDVEFAVQLMQLVTGGAYPDVRGGNTLEALDRLTARGLLTEEEQALFRDGYQFLRTVEHRLQILDEQAVRCLPSAPGALRKFGRRLGYPDGGAFLEHYRQVTRQVNALFRRLFYGEAIAPSPSGELARWVLAPEDPAAQTALRAALVERHFRTPDATLETLRRAVAGSHYGDIIPEARAAFADLAGPLLDAAADTPDPDAALHGLDLLAQSAPSRAALYRTLAESRTLLRRLSLLAADSPFLLQTLRSHLEYVDLLADDEAMDAPPSPPKALPATPPGLAAFLTRARLRTGARDLWGLADTPQVMAELSETADVALAAALTLARSEVGDDGPFAVIGLGKLGGQELGYASDLDVLYVAERGALEAAVRVAQRLPQILHDQMAAQGVGYEVDPRLRPDGRKGVLVLDVLSYQEYYTKKAMTWERQALLKARPVAGDRDLGRRFAALVTDFVYGTPLTEARRDEIRAMKRRIETERAKSPNDLKLAPGGLSDIEWTTQLQQLTHGHRRPRLRPTNTLDALRALRDDAVITQADWETLSDTYVRLTRLRNRLYLKNGIPTDAPPTLPDDLKARMQATRSVVLRLFYGEQTSVGQ